MVPFLFSVQHIQKIRFRQEGNSQFPGLALLGAGVLPCHHIGGFSGDRAGDLAAEQLDLFRGFLPGEGRKGSRQNEGHSCKPGIGEIPGAFKIHTCLAEPFHKVPGLGRSKPLGDALCGDLTDVRDLG